jgi:hypothetical protein
MTRFRMTAAALGLLSAYFMPCVRADEWNKETHLTINVPLQIEDTVLPPGEYVFKLVEPDTDRGVVSIFNSDGTRLETTIMGWSTYRFDAGDKKLLTISQPHGDQPATLQAWFYPGDNVGVEFPAATRAGGSGHVSKTKDKGQGTGKANGAAGGQD